MIHMIIGKEVNRDTKTACGVKLEDLRRTESAVPYASRKMLTCPECINKAKVIATMRKEEF